MLKAAEDNLDLNKIVDPAKLRKALNAIAARHGGASNEARMEVLAEVKRVNALGRETARAMLFDDGGGTACAMRICHLQDVITSALYDYASVHVYRVENPSKSERMTVTAVGGYGRGTLAPGSDIDLLFVLPYKKTPWTEQVVEWILYILWDMGLKVGHATRNVDECIRLSRSDMTIRTAILEARFICGEKRAVRQSGRTLRQGSGGRHRARIHLAKLAERDERHRKAGDTRYLVEPNVKEGKGGLRDLNTLFWIAKYFYHIRDTEELVGLGVLSRREFNLFVKAEDFLWAVRCHMHFSPARRRSGCPSISSATSPGLGYQDHPGLSAVERFMKHYFLVAKDVGDLTRIFCAGLEDQQAKQAPGSDRCYQPLCQPSAQDPRHAGFHRGQGPHQPCRAEVFKRDPVNIIRMFHLADIRGLEFHPDALKRVTRSLRLINAELRKTRRPTGCSCRS
jgi:[protein-PII] uridylyltransferase